MACPFVTKALGVALPQTHEGPSLRSTPLCPGPDGPANLSREA